jgi:uncharacterized membrane protein YeaQ/YmgE (transglycosylase-associated protein family)
MIAVFSYKKTPFMATPMQLGVVGAMIAGLCVAAWIGFLTDISLHGMADLIGHSFIAALLCAVLLVIGVRVRTRTLVAQPA